MVRILINYLHLSRPDILVHSRVGSAFYSIQAHTDGAANARQCVFPFYPVQCYFPCISNDYLCIHERAYFVLWGFCGESMQVSYPELVLEHPEPYFISIQ